MYVYIYIYNMHMSTFNRTGRGRGARQRIASFVQDKGGNTPLHLASMCGDANLKVLLLTCVCACVCIREGVY